MDTLFCMWKKATIMLLIGEIPYYLGCGNLWTGVGFLPLFVATGGPAAIPGVWQESLWCDHVGMPGRDHQRCNQNEWCLQEERYGGEGSCHWRTLHLRVGKPSNQVQYCKMCLCQKKRQSNLWNVRISKLIISFAQCLWKLIINYKMWDLDRFGLSVCISISNHVMRSWKNRSSGRFPELLVRWDWIPEEMPMECPGCCIPPFFFWGVKHGTWKGDAVWGGKACCNYTVCLFFFE